MNFLIVYLDGSTKIINCNNAIELYAETHWESGVIKEILKTPKE